MNTERAPSGNGFALSRDLNPKLLPLEALKPLGRLTRKHPSGQIRKLAEALRQFGFVMPLVVDAESRVVAGWGLVLAARKIGLAQAPAITLHDLDEPRLRLLRLALNRLGEESSWDADALRKEFSDILEINSEVDLGLSGFEMGEIDVALSLTGVDEEDVLLTPDRGKTALTTPGDIWRLGEHFVLCGDALERDGYFRLLGDERAQMVFTDPPWNIAGKAVKVSSSASVPKAGGYDEPAELEMREAGAPTSGALMRMPKESPCE